MRVEVKLLLITDVKVNAFVLHHTLSPSPYPSLPLSIPLIDYSYAREVIVFRESFAEAVLSHPFIAIIGVQLESKPFKWVLRS